MDNGGHRFGAANDVGVQPRAFFLDQSFEMDGVAGDSSGVVGGNEGDHAADIVGLGQGVSALARQA
jgi:hypothetical protein